MKPIFVTFLLSCFYAPRHLGRRLSFASRLRKVRRSRLVFFRAPPSDRGPAWLAHRLCGLPGDLVEIRNGTLFVNGADFDKGLDLTHIFKVDRSNCGNIPHDPRLAYTIPHYPDIIYISLKDRYVHDHRLPCERHVLPPGLRTDSIHRAYKKNWNEDNFGPIKVPPGQWFVLGDDRSHSLDSRHLGFIDHRKFAGVRL